MGQGADLETLFLPSPCPLTLFIDQKSPRREIPVKTSQVYAGLAAGDWSLSWWLQAICTHGGSHAPATPFIFYVILALC